MHAHTKGAHDAYTTGEKGDGFYSLHTKGCFDVIANAKSDILNVLAKMDVNKPGSLNIADFGTADGGTSMPTVPAPSTDALYGRHSCRVLTVCLILVAVADR